MLDFSSESKDTNNPATRILDQLYGQSWRALNVFPLSEPRNRIEKHPSMMHMPMSERYVIMLFV